MDPVSYSASLCKWDTRAAAAALPHPQNRIFEEIAQVLPTPPPTFPITLRPRDQPIGGGLEDLFQGYCVRYNTVAKLAELGFTVNTLLGMTDAEIDEVLSTCHSQIFHWDISVGERYGIKIAIRAKIAERERFRIEDEELRRRARHFLGHVDDNTNNVLDALSQGGLSEEPVQQQIEAAESGGGATWNIVPSAGKKIKKSKKKVQGRRKSAASCSRGTDNDDDEVGDDQSGQGGRAERQREHPFIVTEPGEIARGKKNGLDYLFHLYEQCAEFLSQVQNIAKERGEKCPTKVTNQVFRHAKKAGATYINKPKMRHYVHCYALHCLDEDISNAIRKSFKERGENVGAWRQACFEPLLALAGRQGWDIDGIFSSHPGLSIWYVPTVLRKLCHAQCSNLAVVPKSVSSFAGATTSHSY
ncbi:hypothetical protein IFM89_033545 [Coptis chinensis]|uniref:Floricaula/leafy-like transcription factor n=1 Tax=Coptis chinensis TaxID=261450 RepID=A0A835H6Q1_9MAGN|nr:hypothetical protein IFM89_033545 [Coptis chinensis]